jgi:hypothetical protein
MALNVHALLLHLSTSPDSPLPRLAEGGYAKPSTVFFSYLGFFFVYSFERAKLVYGVLLVGVIAFVTMGGEENAEKREGDRIATVLNGGTKTRPNGFSSSPPRGSSTLKSKKNQDSRIKTITTALLALTGGLLGTLLLPNIIAFVLDKVLGRGMSWFSNEYSVIFLFGLPALLGSSLPSLLLL